MPLTASDGTKINFEKSKLEEKLYTWIPYQTKKQRGDLEVLFIVTEDVNGKPIINEEKNFMMVNLEHKYPYYSWIEIHIPSKDQMTIFMNKYKRGGILAYFILQPNEPFLAYVMNCLIDEIEINN